MNAVEALSAGSDVENQLVESFRTPKVGRAQSVRWIPSNGFGDVQGPTPGSTNKRPREALEAGHLANELPAG